MEQGVSEASKPEPSTPNRGLPMPHDHIRLAQAPNGEIGPRCSMCNKRMTFGAAMVLNNNYVCWTCYVEATGADTYTVVGETVERFYAR